MKKRANFDVRFLLEIIQFEMTLENQPEIVLLVT
jgi:hypothetical protein